MTKVLVAECTHCKRTISGNEFPPEYRTALRSKQFRLRTPIWQWLGAAFLGGAILFGFVVNTLTKMDSRNSLLERDIYGLTKDPGQAGDTVAMHIETWFSTLAADEFDIDDISYKTHIRENAALVLVRIPEIDDYNRESRKQVVEVIGMVAAEIDELLSKDIYIGLLGKFRLVQTKTPYAESDTHVGGQKALFAFYPMEK